MSTRRTHHIYWLPLVSRSPTVSVKQLTQLRYCEAEEKKNLLTTREDRKGRRKNLFLFLILYNRNLSVPPLEAKRELIFSVYRPGDVLHLPGRENEPRLLCILGAGRSQTLAVSNDGGKQIIK